MADTKISDLSAVTNVVGTDEYVLARAGATKKIDAANLLVAGSVAFTPTGTIASTDVQAAIAEVAAEAGTPSYTWTGYTPTLTGSSSNPTLGSGNTIQGRYIQIGKLVECKVQITFGTSGVAAGSGAYYVSLPVNFGASAYSNVRVGTVLLFDSSGSAVRLGGCERDGSNHRLQMYADGLGSAAALVSDASPWTWAANDQIHLTFCYEST